jgi:CPA1 family monovalent cation:H+ antiporter
MLVIVGAIAVTAYARRRAQQPALVITVVGLAASYIPGVPRLELDSDILLGVVLPPLLYSAASSFSVFSFFRKLGAIVRLGVGLVLITALAVAAVAQSVVPGLTAGAAIVLGAVVAPPDAVSAVAIGRELGLRRRVLSVLTGESLVNDATALTIFTIAVASVSGRHSFIDDRPALLFLYSAAVGIAAGLVLAVVALAIRRVLKDPALETVLGLVVPFAAYLLGVQLQASGVLAVVTAGLVIGTLSVRFGYEARLQERQVWSAIDVLLEAFVFAYLGLQLRFVIDDLQAAGASLTTVAGAGLLILLAVIAVRPIAMFLVLAAREVLPVLPSRTQIVEPLTWREDVVVSWTGMRGVVTIAAAAGIPATVESGAPFPGRPEIQAIAYMVAIGTLLVQGSTLPWLIRRLGVQDPAEEALAREQLRAAEHVAREAAGRVYARFVADPPAGVDPQFVEHAAERIERQREAAAEAFAEDGDGEPRSAVGRAIASLSRDVVSEQRRALVEGMREGDLDDEAVRELLAQVDLQEAALNSRLRSRL